MFSSPLLTRPIRYTLSSLAVISSVALVFYGFRSAVLSERFQPHRVCYLEKPDLIWSNVATDGLISLSYVVIFLGLIWVAWRSRRLLDHTMIAFLIAFGTFILACGLTHMMEIIVIWYPFYWLAVTLKGITALASAATAIAFWTREGALIEAFRLYKARLVNSEKERKYALDALIANEKLATIGRLAATISHEINNPIDAVMNIVYCARVHPDLPVELRGLMESADQELRHIVEISHSTLGVYREKASPVETDLAAVVNGSLDLLRSKSLERGVRLLSEISGTALIEAYGGEMRQVVINLVRNGIEASNRGGFVRVIIEPATDSGLACEGYNLIVEDNGCGIPSNFVQMLFRPSTSTKQNGTGIGLWIVRQIIEKHGGTIRVESSVAEPSGTRFVVWLPKVYAAGTLQAPMRPAEAMAS